jgi:hypothetical protein
MARASWRKAGRMKGQAYHRENKPAPLRALANGEDVAGIGIESGWRKYQ